MFSVATHIEIQIGRCARDLAVRHPAMTFTLRAVLRMRVDVRLLGVEDGVLDLVQHLERCIEADVARPRHERVHTQGGQRLDRRCVVGRESAERCVPDPVVAEGRVPSLRAAAAARDVQRRLVSCIAALGAVKLYFAKRRRHTGPAALEH